ncbi:hypothetical protein Drorol1_Dr00013455 [Drosera rotundifolia]
MSLQEKNTGKGSKKVLVAVKASKEIPKTALVWALSHVVQPGDCVNLIVLVPEQTPGPRLWAFPRFAGDCASGMRKRHLGSTSEQKSQITDSCSQMILQLNDSCDPKINVKIKIASASPCGAVAAEAKRLQANWVIMDKQLKHEQNRCLEELHCNLAVMKDKKAKVLRLNLVRSPSKQSNVASSLPSIVEGASMEFCKNKVDHCTKSLRGPVVTPSSSPELFTATELATSSMSSSDQGTSPFSMIEPIGNLKQEDSAVTKNNRDQVELSSDTDSESSSPSLCSTSSEFCPWMPEYLRSNHKSRSTRGKSSSTDDLIWKFAKLDLEPGSRSMSFRLDMDMSANRREVMSTPRTPLAPPPLCSICQYKAPVFGKHPRRFSYAELELATGGFSKANFLAESRFGSVHRGMLSDGQVIAVKQDKLASVLSNAEFGSEVEVLSCAQHRNVVMLIGFCIEGKQRFLVYEYICNGSLDAHLYGRNQVPLEWSARYKIAVGAARGLRYLHEECRVGCIVHRDMRPSNILLTHDYEPLVGDYGLAGLHPDEDIKTETRIIGTFGYMTPNYAQSSNITEKADMYAFGVVLVELITGQKAVDLTSPRGEQCLSKWARPLLEQCAVEELIDPRLGNQYAEQEVYRVMYTASMCIQPDPSSRLRMSQVLQILEGNVLIDSRHKNSPARDGSRSGRIRAYWDTLERSFV